ncbi:MAG: Holliday junction resolvase RuvX [Oscillospiraceae bacterium]|nr:Holliday junction resolvase RuvX [Oscillospiraceae bacterium]MCL2279187.1 Holliday junction resolvase RuvX [Oscillospiraceae bacterium]
MTLAGDAWVIQCKNIEETAQKIAIEAASRGVFRIVVGLPKNMDGSIGPRAERSTEFAEILRSKCDAEVVLWDERMTTMSASRILKDAGKFGKKRKKTIDAVAASIILESYMGSINPKDTF